MKKLPIIFLLGGVLPLYGESLLDQLKKGLQEAQKLAKQVADQKRDLDRCRQEKDKIEEREKKTIMLKDEAYKTVTALNSALKVQISELQEQLKKAPAQRTGPPPIPAGALTPTAPPAAAPPATPAVGKQPVPAQKGREALFESIRAGTVLKPVDKTKPTQQKRGPKTIQEQLEEQLKKRRGSISEEKDDEDNNDEWEE